MGLTEFLKDPKNSVSRERIFYNRLYFDLKVAAARSEYDLQIFEPEVDRDGYDVIFDDRDNQRHIQLKTVLCSSGTVHWKGKKRFLRPSLAYAERLGVEPAKSGLGGGVILIEIDDATNDGTVRYAYTDYFIALALFQRLFFEKGGQGNLRGRRRFSFAEKFMQEVTTGEPRDDISLPKQLFLRVKSSDGLLAMLGLHSNLSGSCYLPADKILQGRDFTADESGLPTAGVTRPSIAIAHKHAEDIFSLLDEADDLAIFTRPT